MSAVNAPRRRLAVLALTAVVGLSACATVPPAKRVALDMVDAMAARGEITSIEQACMRDRIDEYSESRLQEIAQRAQEADVAARAELAVFEEELASCRR